MVAHLLRCCRAIQEHQTQLIDSIKEDIKRLHDSEQASSVFCAQSLNIYIVQNTILILQSLSHVSNARSTPNNRGYHLGTTNRTKMVKHVEDTLGKGWVLCAEGPKPQSESTAFRTKLDTRAVYDS